MSAHLIVTRQGPLKDQGAFAEYQRRTRISPPTGALEPLVVYGNIHSLEGEGLDAVLRSCQSYRNSSPLGARGPYPVRSSGHKSLPLCQRRGAADLVDLATDEMTF